MGIGLPACNIPKFSPKIDGGIRQRTIVPGVKGYTFCTLSGRAKEAMAVCPKRSASQAYLLQMRGTIPAFLVAQCPGPAIANHIRSGVELLRGSKVLNFDR